MEYRIIRSDELYHYGVAGMKWGHRKGPTSLAGTGHRAMAGVYGMNQRYYSRRGNKTAASIMATARTQSLKKAAAADAAKASKAKGARGAKVAKAKSAVNSKTSYKESLRGKASKLGAKAVGKSYKINESVERKKSAVASKVGLKKVAQTHANNADYYRKTSKDLQSGKVGKPRNNYQRAMQALGRSKYATHAIKNSKYLDTQGKAQALAEQGLLREDHRRRKNER